MNVIFVGAYYYEGPVRHLYPIFEIYKALGKIFETVGIECKYFVKCSEVIPAHKTIRTEEFDFELSKCDLLFIWNGGVSRSIEITEKARALGIPIYFSELGWLPQQGTFYFDKKGVNYNSSLRDWQYHPINTAQVMELNIKLAHYHSQVAKRSGIEEKDFIFVPLQDETDSQILNHSPKIKKMQQLVEYVCSFVAQKIIFKVHPRFDPGKIKIPGNCKIYRSGTTHDFLSQAKYVITINSTVGAEALTYFKPVINLGDAFYESRKITFKVNNDDEFKLALSWAEKGEVALGVIEAFLYHLFSQQWYMSYLLDPKRVFKLIENITDLQNE